MPRSKSKDAGGSKKSAKKPIEQYEHTHETRANNPPVGLVKPENDPDAGKPARIFMGDSGALTLGFLLGAVSIHSSLKAPAAVASVGYFLSA
jgi:hypothetical protein